MGGLGVRDARGFGFDQRCAGGHFDARVHGAHFELARWDAVMRWVELASQPLLSPGDYGGSRLAEL